MTKHPTTRKTSAYRSIKTDASQYQCPAAQAAAAKSKAPSPQEIKRKLEERIGSMPKTDAEVDAVLARCAPAQPPKQPVLQSRAKPLAKKFGMFCTRQLETAAGAACCIPFAVIILREVCGLAPIIWEFATEVHARGVVRFSHWMFG